MRRSLLAIALVAIGLPAGAQMYGAEYTRCSESSTVGIVDCVSAAAKNWDKRLNTAYKALARRSDPAQREPLKGAQRLWVQYRDANCRFYRAGEGSISQVEAAECVRAMTQQRTCEMETASRPEGGPVAGCR